MTQTPQPCTKLHFILLNIFFEVFTYPSCYSEKSLLKFVFQPHNTNILCCHNITNRLLRFSLSSCADLEYQLACHLLCYRKVLGLLYDSLNGRNWEPTELAGFSLLWQNMSQRLSVNTSDKHTKGISGCECAIVNIC